MQGYIYRQFVRVIRYDSIVITPHTPDISQRSKILILLVEAK
ncbi:hypothetical protein [Nostoc sp.]